MLIRVNEISNNDKISVMLLKTSEWSVRTNYLLLPLFATIQCSVSILQSLHHENGKCVSVVAENARIFVRLDVNI